MKQSETTANEQLASTAAAKKVVKVWAPDYFAHNSDVEQQRSARRDVRRVLRSPRSSFTGVDPYNSNLGKYRVLQ